MRRRMIVGVFVVGLLLATRSSVALAAPASGGGGHACPEPQSDSHTTSVDVKEGCMLPTGVRVQRVQAMHAMGVAQGMHPQGALSVDRVQAPAGGEALT